MATLNEKQVDEIFDLLVYHKLSHESLQIDLLDHICCMVEQKMESGLDYKESLSQSIQEFGLHNLQEIQEATVYLLTLKLQKMKTVASIAGIVSALLIMTGVLFKMYHFPGASILLVLGLSTVCLLVFPIMAYTELQNGEGLVSKLNAVVGYLAAILLSLATMFKIFHWPGFYVLYYTGLAMLVFVFIPLFTIRNFRTTGNKLFALAKSMLILAGIAVFWGLIPINTTKASATKANNEHRVEE